MVTDYIVSTLVGVIGLILAVPFMYLTTRLIQSDKVAYKKNKARSGTWKKVFFGEIPATQDGQRDYGISAGLSVQKCPGAGSSKPKYVWFQQGKLSKESVDAVLH